MGCERKRSLSARERVALVLLVLLRAASARASEVAPAEPTDDAKRACIAEHEQAQISMRAGRLTETRAVLLACSQDGCPSMVRADCSGLLEAVNMAIPSVIVSAKSRDRDEDHVLVTMDGEVVASRLDGRPVELDPGLHRFRFEASSQEPVERQIVLVEGEKNRILAVVFQPSQPAPWTAATPLAPELYRPVPALDYVLGATALAGIADFAGFGIWGLDERKSLQSSCSPSCSGSQISSVRTKLIAADAGLGVAVLSMVGGGYVYLTRGVVQRTLTPASGPRLAPGSTTTVALTPAPSGVLFSIQGAL